MPPAQEPACSLSFTGPLAATAMVQADGFFAFLPGTFVQFSTIDAGHSDREQSGTTRYKPCAVRVAREFGVRLERHVATVLTPEIVASADVIFVMDALNEAGFLSRFPEARGELFLLGAFSPKALLYDEISDPYEGSEQAVRDCFRNLETCIAEAVNEIRDLIPPKETRESNS